MASITTLAPFVSSPRTERSVWFLNRTLMTVLATAEETGGQYSLVLAHLRKGGELAPCTHYREDETFYILEGAMTFHTPNQSIMATPGTCVFLPRGMAHGFSVESNEAKALVLLTPGGFEGFFAALGEPAPSLTLPPPPAGPPDQAKLLAAHTSYGSVLSKTNSAEETDTTSLLTARPFASKQTPERSIWYLERSLMTVLATAEETDGQFGLVSVHTRKDGAPPPHTHSREDETFYIIAGEMTFFADDQVFHAAAGDCVFLPRGIEHHFTIDSDEAEGLVLVTPGGFEGFFLAQSVPAPSLTLPPPPIGPPDIATLMAVSAQYGNTMRVPPREHAETVAPPYAAAVSAHYTSGNLGERLLAMLRATGKDIDALQVDDLTPVDQFHSGGKAATLQLIARAGLRPGMHVLDVGGGIGGPARLLATQAGCTVTVLDLSEEFCAVGTMITARLGLADKVTFQHGSALDMPFADGSFDAVWTQNATMNIAEKERLYAEIARVLRPGGRFAMQEPMAGPVQPIHFPVPWARDASISFLRPADAVRTLLANTGFREVAWVDQGPLLLAAFQQQAGTPTPSELPTLSLALLVGPQFPEMMQTFGRNLQEDRVTLIQSVFERTH